MENSYSSRPIMLIPFTGQHIRLRYLSGCRAMKAQVSLRKCTFLSGPLQLVTWMCWFCFDVPPKGPAWSEVRGKLEKVYQITKENRICNSGIPLPL